MPSTKDQNDDDGPVTIREAAPLGQLPIAEAVSAVKRRVKALLKRPKTRLKDM